MRIAIQFAGRLPVELLEACVRSVRRYMDCPIVQLTDLKTEKLPFMDEVQRIDEDGLIEARYKHLSTIAGDVLSLDYDTIVQKDVSGVFNETFDVALTKRNFDDEKKFLHMMSPHNLGVIFTRNNKFWRGCLNRYRKYPKTNGWMLGQVNVTEFANVNKQFKVMELPASLYNYTPGRMDENLEERYIIHYKGNKKHWMVSTRATYEEGHRVGLMAIGSTAVTPDHPYINEMRAHDHR